jgi:hypothetical protein
LLHEIGFDSPPRPRRLFYFPSPFSCPPSLGSARIRLPRGPSQPLPAFAARFCEASSRRISSRRSRMCEHVSLVGAPCRCPAHDSSRPSASEPNEQKDATNSHSAARRRPVWYSYHLIPMESIMQIKDSVALVTGANRGIRARRFAITAPRTRSTSRTSSSGQRSSMPGNIALRCPFGHRVSRMDRKTQLTVIQRLAHRPAILPSVVTAPAGAAVALPRSPRDAHRCRH